MNSDPKQINTLLSTNDYLLHLLIRLGIGRSNYIVDPGIYFTGEPDKSSPLFVSSNYKMSFNKLRASLSGISSWILVIDTEGINVWCAAGKGTFATNEVIEKIRKFEIIKIINHKNLILPQLCATGVSAHKIKDETGLNVIYGPVRTHDLPAFLNNNFMATSEMRGVRFNLIDRIVLTPIELIQALKYIFLLIFALFLIIQIANLINPDSNNIFKYHFIILYPILACLSGCVITPILLPYIPFRSFSLKGWITGIILFVTTFLFLPLTFWAKIGTLFLFPSISAFLALNFTGSSTYTSPSGVKQEMKWFIRPMLASSIIGFVIILLFLFGAI